MENIEQIKAIVDYGVLGLLGLLSILVVAFAIERWLFFAGSIRAGTGTSRHLSWI